MDQSAQLVVDARATLGEGPVWHPGHQRLTWVDIQAGKLHVYDPRGEADRVYDVGCLVGAAVPRQSGGMILATEHGFEAFEFETCKRTPLGDPEAHLPNNRFNDGKCDARGRFWAGTMSMVRELGAGSLYVLEPGGEIRHVLGGVTTSNGLGWSPDGRTMYYIDTPTLQVAAFDFDETRGTITGRRVAVSFPEGVGRPDGMAVDAEGMLWIAHWDGGRVTRWNPGDGSLLATIRVPADRTSCCAFGGEDLDILFITTARHGLSAEALQRQPHAGGLFAARPAVRGLASHSYAG